jgi:hypothetical protein
LFKKDITKKLTLFYGDENMNLEDIKGTYDSIFSLGHFCLSAIQMKKNNLRPFAGVLDWVGSPSLPDVNRLLRNRFVGFWEPSNMRVIGHATPKDLLVSDDAYKIYFNHDFKTDINTPTHLAAFPDVKEKYNRRIQRFLEKMTTSQRILFIRTKGTLEEVRELEMVLAEMVKNDFQILLVNHTNVNRITEKNWPLKKVCVVELPGQGKRGEPLSNENDHYWKMIFNGVNIAD